MFVENAFVLWLKRGIESLSDGTPTGLLLEGGQSRFFFFFFLVTLLFSDCCHFFVVREAIARFSVELIQTL